MWSEERSMWSEWFFPSISALVTIFLVYIVYKLLTPFRHFFRHPCRFCIRRMLPTTEGVETVVPTIQAPSQVKLE
jgi:hypothetical protein